ncbi:MAG: TadE/TadG family type IV pilus assembly protein [Rhizobiaceae bacterium]
MALKILNNPLDRREVKHSRRSIWNRFRKNEDGATAIEFSILAVPFLIITFAIFETGLSYFANRTLEASVSTMARKIRLGQITATTYAGVAADDFKNELCDLPTMLLFDCAKLVVDVKTIENFEEPDAPQYDVNGNLRVENFDFSPGAGGTINIVSVYYDWSRFFDFSSLGYDLDGDNPNMMRSVTAFMNESFN